MHTEVLELRGFTSGKILFWSLNLVLVRSAKEFLKMNRNGNNTGLVHARLQQN